VLARLRPTPREPTRPGDPPGGLRGRARGAAAALAGLEAEVPLGTLARLLDGRHATTGRPLISAVGSAGRAHTAEAPPPAGRWLSLAEAARVIGVDPSYLRRLATRTAAASAGPPRRPEFHAEKDTAGHWRVDRDEVLRFRGERPARRVVAAYDITCAAPKSLSILWAIGDNDLRGDIAAAMNTGIDAVIDYLAATAALARVHGQTRPGIGFAVASYLLDASPTGDPHLRLHNIVINALPVQIEPDSEPVWRAVHATALSWRTTTAGYLGAAAMRHELSRRRGLTWSPVRNGVAELDAFPTQVLKAFSTRRRQLLQELQARGMATDGAGRDRARRWSLNAGHATPLCPAELGTRLERLGWSPARLLALAAPRRARPVPPGGAEVSGLVRALVAPTTELAGAAGVTRWVVEREVVRAVASWAGDRLPHPEIIDVVRRVLAALPAEPPLGPA
jgi:conjugative relaxase-like TrwC/TraI family protein